ncbi:hypothetical protein AVEN_36021-1 [Araneus ventricosus]|uniref:Uncharacterized protein n=1 Tax=Araneus ventricosus TaxID=182803 RepID=A0A4Y2KJ00_ARAVE|nr:hypothetical protein AVEN_36021-1 [Araneus ventricosus]
MTHSLARLKEASLTPSPVVLGFLHPLLDFSERGRPPPACFRTFSGDLPSPQVERGPWARHPSSAPVSCHEMGGGHVLVQG